MLYLLYAGITIQYWGEYKYCKYCTAITRILSPISTRCSLQLDHRFWVWKYKILPFLFVGGKAKLLICTFSLNSFTGEPTMRHNRWFESLLALWGFEFFFNTSWVCLRPVSYELIWWTNSEECLFLMPPSRLLVVWSEEDFSSHVWIMAIHWRFIDESYKWRRIASRHEYKQKEFT